MLTVDASAEPVAQLLGHLARLVIATRGIGGHDHRAQIAKVDLIDAREGGVGFVSPLGRAQTRKDLLGEGQQAVGAYLGLAHGSSSFVLLLDGLAYSRDATTQQLLGDGLLLFGKLGEHCGAVHTSGPQAGRLGDRGRRWSLASRRASRSPFGTWSTPIGAGAAFGARWTIGAGAAFGACWTIRAGAAFGACWTIRAGAAFRACWTIRAGSTVSVGARRPIAARTTVTVGTGSTVTVALATLLHERARNELLVASGADHVDTGGLDARALRRKYGDDVHTVEELLDVDLENVTDLRVARQHGAVDIAFRLLGPGGAPGPTAIGARAGELDVDPAGHRAGNLLPEPSKQRAGDHSPQTAGNIGYVM